MARPLRLQVPGGIYHVTARGNSRAAVYRDDEDRTRFLSIFELVVERFGWICHSYCLMGNHYHLLIQTPIPNLSRGMRQLNGVYAQRFNRRYRRVGHVFQARFDAALVEQEGYFREVARYIVLNPVRARIVEHPRDWPWSSYRPIAGEASPPSFLTITTVLGEFADDHTRAQTAYTTYIEAGIGVDPPVRIGGIYSGSSAFAGAHAPKQRIDEVPRRQWDPIPPPLEQLLATREHGSHSAKSANISESTTPPSAADYKRSKTRRDTAERIRPNRPRETKAPTPCVSARPDPGRS